MMSPELEPLAIDHRGKILRGTLYMGNGPEVMLLCHGFGGTRTGPGRLFVEMARALQAEGTSVLTFDRIGHGESCGSLADVTIEDEIAQLCQMLGAGPARGRMVHVVGHSLGAMEAASLAARMPDRISSLTLLAPAAAIVDDVARGQIIGRSLGPIRAGGIVEHDGQAVAAPIVDSARTFNPYAGLRSYRGPVTLHHGTADRLVAPSYSERYAKLLPRATLHLHDGADHDFSDVALRRRIIAGVQLHTAVPEAA